MANAVTAYRDVVLSDRSNDAASIVAMLAFFEEASPQAPPLPPLAAARRVGTQNLPPVRNLLPQHEETGQSKFDGNGTSQNNGNGRKVSSIAQLVESTPTGDKAGNGASKPLKRGPKGPRKYTAPRPLGPLKTIAPKSLSEELEDSPTPLSPSGKNKPKKASPKKPAKPRPKKSDIPQSTTVGSGIPSDSMANVNMLHHLNGTSELDLRHTFNIPDYATMEAALLGSAGTSMDHAGSNVSDHSTPFHELHHSHFNSLQGSPHGHHEIPMHQNLMAAMAYTSPETQFSPVSDGAPGTFGHMYHSPAFPTSHSGHVTPHSAISPLHSLHNSPRTFRTTLDHIPLDPVHSGASEHQTLPSHVQTYSNRLGNGNSNMSELMNYNGQFQTTQTTTNYNPPRNPPPDALRETNTQSSGKRKRAPEKTTDPSDGKRRTLKPRTAVTAIQSVLNPTNDGMVTLTGQTTTGPLPPSHKGRNLSPKKKRFPIPLAINSPTPSIVGDGHITPRLVLSETIAATDPSNSLAEEHARQFGLHNVNSLSMVLNSETASSLASPQLYEFSALDNANPSTDILNHSNPRGLSGRLPVQSLLTLPPIPSQTSPSMQVMHIPHNLLQQDAHMQNLDLNEQRRVGRTQVESNPNSFDMRMAMDQQANFATGLADVVGGSLQPSSSWAEILLQPSSTQTFQTEMPNQNQQLFNGNQMSRMDNRNINETAVKFNGPTTTTAPSQGIVPPSPERFVETTTSADPPSKAGKKRRRGKHTRYVAAESKNGEPAKTHIDVLVTAIQKSEIPTQSSENPAQDSQFDGGMDVSVTGLSRNSLPSIETLQLDSGATQGQGAQERTMLDGMAGIPSSSDQSSNNNSFNMLDLLAENLEWNDLILPQSSNQAPVANRYNQPQWSQNDYQESMIPDNTAPFLPDPSNNPPRITPTGKRGRKSKEEKKRAEEEKAKQSEPSTVKSKTKVALYGCQQPGCTAKFHQLQHLKTHLDSHNGIKRFKCSFAGCDKDFSQKGNLKAHQRKHTGEKPFICDECNKSFAQKGNLQTHKMVHTGAKPFVCLIDNCTARYSQRGNLKMHQNKFHTETIQRLTTKAEASARGGPPLNEGEKKLADHLKILYKFANKGIKGRGKKENEPKPSTQQDTRAGQQHSQPQGDTRVFNEPTLLPPPVNVQSHRGIEGDPSYLGVANPTSSWSRGERMEGVYVGSQGHGQAQANFMGIPGDGGSGAMGMGGYGFGSMG